MRCAPNWIRKSGYVARRRFGSHCVVQLGQPATAAVPQDTTTAPAQASSSTPASGADKKDEDKDATVTSKTPTRYSGVLLNLYRNGQDSITWHSDDEKMLKLMAPIASLSFGSERVFKMRHKSAKHKTIHVRLRRGSLLIMGGRCQQHWVHAVEKDEAITEPRVNATLREYAFMGA